MVSRLKTLSKEFREILRLTSLEARALKLPIYLVGGVVRDLLLKREVLDLDIVVTGDAHILAQAIGQALNCQCRRHHSFGTATVQIGAHKIDFATARTEEYTCGGALPKVKPACLKDDLLRRDFTINAMAISLNKSDYGCLIDVCGGLSDLNNGRIRVMHERSFLDDPTRILRALRFEQRFAFSLHGQTRKLLRESLDQNVFTTVSAHRLRDELILSLKEQQPYKCIRRIDGLCGFSFLDKKITIGKQEHSFFRRLEKEVADHELNYDNHRPVELWIVYLAGLLVNLPKTRLEKFLSDFAFRRGERIIISSIKHNIKEIKKINKPLLPSQVYKSLSDFSFEALLFFYAYYSLSRLRKNIDNFFNIFVLTRLKINGQDLDSAGLKPKILYGQLLRELLYRKLDKGFRTKSQELKEVELIFSQADKAGVRHDGCLGLRKNAAKKHS